jgi:hypothetical protein
MEHGLAIGSKPILSILKSCPKNLWTRSTFALSSREWRIGRSAIALFPPTPHHSTSGFRAPVEHLTPRVEHLAPKIGTLINADPR